MKKSLRNVANLLLAFAIVPFGISTLSVITAQCGADSAGCLASLAFGYDSAVVAYQTDFSISQSTPAYTDGGVTFAGVMSFVQLVSAYSLIVSVLILIALECIELYYIRQFLGSRKRAR